MKKTQFLKELKKALTDKGFDATVVDNEIASVSAYFSEEGLEEIEIPVGEMAEEISTLISEQTPPADPAASVGLEQFELEDPKTPDLPANEEENKAPEIVIPAAAVEATAPAAEEEDVTDNLETDQPLDPEVEPEGEKLHSPKALFDPKEKDASAPAEKAQQSTASKTVDPNASLDFDDEDDVKTYEKGSVLGAKKKKEATAQPETPAVDHEIDEFSYAEFDEEKVKSPAFTVLLIFALPLIALLSLVAVVIYLGFWVLLALVMIAVVAFLIAFVAAGVTVALVGIVYGVIMMLKGNVPVGLFEIGLGICVGAAVMFFGILIYNFAIRLIPFAMKMLAKLLGFAFVKVKEGLKAVKKMLVRAERGQ